jgi:hypothetical protein
MILFSKNRITNVLTQQEKQRSITNVVVRVAPNDPNHAKHANAIQTTNFSAVVRSKKLLCICVKRTVDRELFQLV